ncbi:hypothetical protein BJ684DRAFT_14768 [Piptocephalis cylindrospora]|uniref:Uncharacterized protein n=1 Tax=Piptocephalis cylindrospora TaxID=1907219 RepID=A0A4P9Y7C0_9FUNG|nr:hypothetical protein BJ684DRAFT_14768 [Piptocephalis cylindrospora]|eukprot:RKP14935.1 hypothetical protein BJ684DRAFT_14768 [Piptocephalis cylindrospora]
MYSSLDIHGWMGGPKVKLEGIRGYKQKEWRASKEPPSLAPSFNLYNFPNLALSQPNTTNSAGLSVYPHHHHHRTSPLNTSLTTRTLTTLILVGICLTAFTIGSPVLAEGDESNAEKGGNEDSEGEEKEGFGGFLTQLRTAKDDNERKAGDKKKNKCKGFSVIVKELC